MWVWKGVAVGGRDEMQNKANIHPPWAAALSLLIAVILSVFILTILSKLALSLLAALQAWPWCPLVPSLQPAHPSSALTVSLITSLTEMQELMAMVTIRGRKMKIAAMIRLTICPRQKYCLNPQTV